MRNDRSIRPKGGLQSHSRPKLVSSAQKLLVQGGRAWVCDRLVKCTRTISCGATARHWHRSKSAPRLNAHPMRKRVSLSDTGDGRDDSIGCNSDIVMCLVSCRSRNYLTNPIPDISSFAPTASQGLRSIEDRDAESTVFEQLFSSGKHEALKDPLLNALWRCVRLIRWVCGVSFALLLITFLVFRSDSNHLWDFLVDLGRY